MFNPCKCQIEQKIKKPTNHKGSLMVEQTCSTGGAMKVAGGECPTTLYVKNCPLCGMVWCGVVWCGVVWCGVV